MAHGPGFREWWLAASGLGRRVRFGCSVEDGSGWGKGHLSCVWRRWGEEGASSAATAAAEIMQLWEVQMTVKLHERRAAATLLGRAQLVATVTTMDALNASVKQAR